MSSLPGAEPLIYAGMWRRLFAFLADAGTLLLLAALINLPLMNRTPGVDLTNTIRVLWLTSIIVSVRLSGTTLGKYTFNVEVRSIGPGQKRPPIWELAMRETVFRWISICCFMDYGRTFSDGRRRYW